MSSPPYACLSIAPFIIESSTSMQISSRIHFLLDKDKKKKEIVWWLLLMEFSHFKLARYTKQGSIDITELGF